MLQCFNSMLLHDTLPVDLPDLWPSDILILAFLVFNPWDLYYLGYKKNNNNTSNTTIYNTPVLRVPRKLVTQKIWSVSRHDMTWEVSTYLQEGLDRSPAVSVMSDCLVCRLWRRRSSGLALTAHHGLTRWGQSDPDCRHYTHTGADSGWLYFSVR